MQRAPDLAGVAPSAFASPVVSTLILSSACLLGIADLRAALFPAEAGQHAARFSHEIYWCQYIKHPKYTPLEIRLHFLIIQDPAACTKIEPALNCARPRCTALPVFVVLLHRSPLVRYVFLRRLLCFPLYHAHG